MKTITFRPLRRIKITGKITIASYMQWRNVRTADYNNFNLIIKDEYKQMPPDEYVHNHKGEVLFWFNYNPAEIPVFNHSIIMNLENIRAKNKMYGIRWDPEGRINYNARGLDCDGVPTFSHYTANIIANNYNDMNKFEPLTVKTVVQCFGWFLYQLENSRL